VEVGPRDGLQNEATKIATADKIELVDRLSRSGLRKIEVTSFVHPTWVPQMADASDVMAGIARQPGVHYAALTPNVRGYENARAANANEVAVFAAASETFAQKNTNCSIDESFDRFAPLIAMARADGIPVRGYVSCGVVCPYEGDVAPAAVRDVSARLWELGCYEISIGDTVGQGTPGTIIAMLEAVARAVPVAHIAGHYHDTNGQAIDNIRASLGFGVRTFDAAVGGLGGCPYAPGAAGNVATEAVLALLDAEGFATGVDRAAIAEAAQFARSLRSQA
ncbi:MAG: hydroxymethylglutaryl-CoA lyase, partial [Pseudomonadota bacterium]